MFYYGNNGTYIGTWNTSSTNVILPNTTDISVVMKPNAVSHFSDPVNAVSDGFAWIQTNWISLAVVFTLVAIYFGGKRR
jgi:hypothetical protein